MIKQTCNEQRRPRCVAAIPKIEKLLAAARGGGATVVYSRSSPSPATFPNPVIDMFRRLRPKAEPVVTAHVDKFLLGDKDIGLQKILKDKGITTLVTVTHHAAQWRPLPSLAALRGFNVSCR
jgi:nicotinamidase-related amidase